MDTQESGLIANLSMDLLLIFCRYLNTADLEKAIKLGPTTRKLLNQQLWKEVMVVNDTNPTDILISHCAMKVISLKCFESPETHQWIKKEYIYKVHLYNMKGVHGSLILNQYPNLKTLRLNLRWKNFSLDYLKDFREQKTIEGLTSNLKNQKPTSASEIEVVNDNMEMIEQHIHNQVENNGRSEFEYLGPLLVSNVESVSYLNVTSYFYQKDVQPFVKLLQRLINLEHLIYLPKNDQFQQDEAMIVSSFNTLKNLKLLETYFCNPLYAPFVKYYKVHVTGIRDWSEMRRLANETAVRALDHPIPARVKALKKLSYGRTNFPSKVIELPQMHSIQFQSVFEELPQLAALDDISFPNLTHVTIHTFPLEKIKMFLLEYKHQLRSLNIESHLLQSRLFILNHLTEFKKLKKITIENFKFTDQARYCTALNIWGFEFASMLDDYSPIAECFSTALFHASKGLVDFDLENLDKTDPDKLFQQLKSVCSSAKKLRSKMYRNTIVAKACQILMEPRTLALHDPAISEPNRITPKSLPWHFAFCEAIFDSLYQLPEIETIRLVGVPEAFESPRFDRLVGHPTVKHIYLRELFKRETSDLDNISYKNAVETHRGVACIKSNEYENEAEVVDELYIDVHAIQKQSAQPFYNKKRPHEETYSLSQMTCDDTTSARFLNPHAIERLDDEDALNIYHLEPDVI